MDTTSAPHRAALPSRPSYPKRYSSSSRPQSPPIPPQTPHNRLRVHPASPEVITSLITSLSTISSQAEKHFDSLTTKEDLTYAANHQGLPRSRAGNAYEGRSGNKDDSHHSGFGVDYGAYRNREVDDEAESSIPDAAIPPVVRMGKQRNLAPIDTSKRLSLKKSNSSLRSSSADGRHSPSFQGAESQRATSPRHTSFSSKQKLARRSSKESIRSVEDREIHESQQKKMQGFLGDDLATAVSTGASRPLRRLPSSRSLMEERIDEAIVEHEPSEDRDRPSSNDHRSATPGSLSPDDGTSQSPGGLGSGRSIPSRQSSLRHSFSGSSPSKQKKAARHSRHSMAGQRDIKVDTDLPEEEDGVVKRIRELQAAKQRRDKEFQAVTGESYRRTRQRQADDGPTPSERSSTRPGARRSHTGPNDAQVHRAPAIREGPAPAPAVATGKSRSLTAISATAANIPLQQGRKSSEAKASARASSPKRASSLRENKRASGTFSPTRTSFGDGGRPSTSDSIDEAVEEYLSSPRLSQKVKHPQSGRIIAFSEVGDPNGFAVFCCVGMGLTRYLTAFYDELAKTLKLRLITPDRPGVGESEPCFDGSGTPLAWPDDVAIICNHLKITKFSLLAHSAGAIYALATALRMPQQIRGRVHLLAPWIPPSQMSSIGSHREPLPSGAVPYSHRILRALPASFLKAANSSFMSATSTSITSSLPKSPRRSNTKRRSMPPPESPTSATKLNTTPSKAEGDSDTDPKHQKASNTSRNPDVPDIVAPPVLDPETQIAFDQARARDYEECLTHAIWHLATSNSNPALDLLTCLERRRPIGFRYVDITRAVVIHHGTRDTRVPVENVKWLGKVMRRCEVRILENEGHGLMAVPGVMGDILTEIAKEWEDWAVVTQSKRERRRSSTVNSSAIYTFNGNSAFGRHSSLMAEGGTREKIATIR